MAAQPSYTDKVTVGGATLTLADAGAGAPANALTIFTPDPAAAKGGQVERITWTPLGTVTDTVLRIWLYDGATYRLKFELPVQAYTNANSSVRPTGTAEAVSNPQLFPQLVPAGSVLKASLNDAQAAGVSVSATGGSF